MLILPELLGGRSDQSLTNLTLPGSITAPNLYALSQADMTVGEIKDVPRGLSPVRGGGLSKSSLFDTNP